MSLDVLFGAKDSLTRAQEIARALLIFAYGLVIDEALRDRGAERIAEVRDVVLEPSGKLAAIKL